MKKLFILGLIIFSNLSCKAQILPIENEINYIGTGISMPDNINYIKDVNNLRSRYIGNWKGVYNGKNYQLIINRRTGNYNEINEDGLVIKYLITDLNGSIIEDIRSLPDNSPYVLKSRYLRNMTYVMVYVGRESKCGQRGELFITPQKATNYSTMKLFLAPSQDFILQSECPNGSAKQLFPLQQMELTKQ
ncbi:MAG: hypothetical protein KA210_08635 [Bacteroidia bacterium]|nr:hypothetical protein [Bacteroidia bacterium]